MLRSTLVLIDPATHPPPTNHPTTPSTRHSLKFNHTDSFQFPFHSNSTPTHSNTSNTLIQLNSTPTTPQFNSTSTQLDFNWIKAKLQPFNFSSQITYKSQACNPPLINQNGQMAYAISASCTSLLLNICLCTPGAWCKYRLHRLINSTNQQQICLHILR